jgi:Molybdopterin-binding domain of aldehyde dehydrogenase
LRWSVSERQSGPDQHRRSRHAAACGFNVPLVAATLAGMPADDHIAPGNIFQNSAIPYKFANVKTVCRRLARRPRRVPAEVSRTYIAAVAEVEVKRSTGDIRVTKFYLAHDCGQIVNPDGLRNQLDGNVIQTISRTLMEELKYDRSAVTSLDWESYPILRFLAGRSDRRPAPGFAERAPVGAPGSPPLRSCPPRSRTRCSTQSGVRLRSVPFRPDKVTAAMKGAGAARIAAILAGESPVSRGVQSLL